MKAKKIFLGTLLLSALTYTSCNDDSTAVDPSQIVAASTLTTDEVTTSLKTDIAVEDIAILVNDQFEAKIGSSTSPTVPPAPYTSMLPANADATYADTDTGTSTAPTKTRTITITFGATAKCVFRGHDLKGQIILAHTFTTSTTKDVTVAFNNFSVNDNKVEGKATWKQEQIAATTTVPIVPAHPKNTLTMIDLKFSTSNGSYIRNGWVAREMTSGYATRLDLTDDINTVNIANVTLNPGGYSLSSFTIAALNTPLIYKTSCSLASNPFAGSGTVFITKGSHSAIIKYGTGDCDNLSRLAIDMKLNDYFTMPIQYNSGLVVPVTTPPATPPNNTDLIAKFDAKFDEMAVPFTLQ